jgi:Family of unknown function (DUF6152)
MHTRTRYAVPLLTAFVVAAGSHSSYGHHSPAQFDLSRTLTIEATVTKFEWINPHVFVQVETVGDNGQPQTWQIEGDAPSTLLPLGWSSDSLKPGDRVTVEASPPRNAARRTLLGRSITRADGVILMPKPMFVRARSSPSSLSLSEDRNSLSYEFRVEDPEYLLEHDGISSRYLPLQR